MIRVGIVGAGGIAGTMARTLNGMDPADAVLAAIASRDLKKAESFAETFGAPKAYGSYQELYDDPDIDLIYVAVPHSHHYQVVMDALRAGKHILCEKAFAANAGQAKEMLALAEEKHLLLTEAIWTRYMPSRKMIDDLIKSGIIGKVRTISANLCYDIDANQRMIDPALAGGCMLDLSVYVLNFASMVKGNSISSLIGHCVLTGTGVDGQDQIMIVYKDGSMASLFTSMYVESNRMGLICGETGFIEVENINNPQQIRVYRQVRDDFDSRATMRLVRTLEVPAQITGYEYEVLACKKAIEEGAPECPEMPHSETLEIMRQMDELRAQFGITFPFE